MKDSIARSYLKNVILILKVSQHQHVHNTTTHGQFLDFGATVEVHNDWRGARANLLAPPMDPSKGRFNVEFLCVFIAEESGGHI